MKESAPGIFTFEIFSKYPDRMRHAVFDRSIPIDDHALVHEKMRAARQPVSFKKQLHSAHVVIVRHGELPDEGDALIATTRDIPLVIRIADCASILLYDPRMHAIGNIHAGWRGIAKNIIRGTVDSMIREFGTQPSDLLSAVSPMIGPCCSIFSNPREELPKHLHSYIRKNNAVDLWQAIEDQLRACGISQIEHAKICTSCDHAGDRRFYSHRRDANGGRFGTAIMLR